MNDERLTMNENEDKKTEAPFLLVLPLKVCASEQESSLLELLPRAQPKLNNAVVNLSTLNSSANANRFINFFHLKKPIARR